MAKIYFMCGFIGSGKTTYAKQLVESESAFRFSVDEWMIPLFGEHMERAIFDARLATLLELFKESALQMRDLGVSVILDFGFWRKEQRLAIAQWASENKLDYELIYLDTDFAECSKRALARNAEADDKDYQMTAEMLNELWARFEEPEFDEPLRRIKSTS